MMNEKYLNTQRHARIWFSNSPNKFINLENERRIEKFEKDNPRAKMTIVYASSLLNDRGIKHQEDFAKKHPNIEFIDFDTEFGHHCDTEKEREIYQITQKEIQAFREKKVEILGQQVTMCVPCDILLKKAHIAILIRRSK